MTKRTTLGFVDPDEQTHAIIGQRAAAYLSQGNALVGFPDRDSAEGIACPTEIELLEGAIVGAGINGGYHAPCRNR